MGRDSLDKAVTTCYNHLMENFTKRQAAGIERFFESIGRPEDTRSADRLEWFNYHYAANGDACGICGHFIKHVFHLKDREFGGLLYAGSDCIESYLQVTGQVLSSFRAYKKKAIKDFKNRDKKVALQMVSDLIEETKATDKWIVECLDMLKNLNAHNNWDFSEKQRAWARKVVVELRKRRNN